MTRLILVSSLGIMLGCSLVKNADDVVVGNGAPDSTLPLLDATVDSTTDVRADATDATDVVVVEEDRRWALWPVPATTPTSYDTPSTTVVLDKVTGLHWQKDARAKATFADAEKACADLTLGVLKDWRLPFRVELVSLLAISGLNVPTINHTFFPGTPSTKQWTASSRPKGGIYVVDFASGSVGTALDTELLEFRCVHSP